VHRSDAAINPLAWLCWFAAAAAVPLVSRNPFYLLLDLLVVSVVYLTRPRRDPAARAWRLFALVGLTLATFSVGFNLLTVHVGDATMARLSDWLPIVGGRLTWNGLVYGVLSALAIGTLLLAATAFNTSVRHGELLRLLPGRVAGLGVAGGVALTMIPHTISAGRDILDAQRSRGYRLRGLRDARVVIVPLLATGLERALTLSEALETRGFGASAMTAQPQPRRGLVALAALALVGGLLALGAGHLPLGVALLALAVVAAVLATPARMRRTRLRPLRWNTSSLVVTLAAGATLAGLLTASSLLHARLYYDPFPRLNRPTFEPLAGGSILLLLAPLLWLDE
jgi:energy-coupling factor transport system permease protein